MSWVTIIWSMTGASCLVLAVIHFVIWVRQGDKVANLAYALVAASVMAFAGCELAAMFAQTPESYATIMRWMHVPITTFVLAMIWFTRAFLHAGRPWLAWGVAAVILAALVLNFTSPVNLDYRNLPRLETARLLGEDVTRGVADPNPALAVGHLGLILLLVFMVDASLMDWRRGNRRRAAVVGVAMALFMAYATVQSALVLSGWMETPVLVAVAYLIPVVPMGFELSHEVLQAGQLARRLAENQKQLELAASAAGLGYWTWDLANDQIWASTDAHRLFSDQSARLYTIDEFLNLVMPEDRELIRGELGRAFTSDAEYQAEYRALLPTGGVRWIAARGRAERGPDGKPHTMRGVLMDVTERKNAEERFRQVVEASPGAIVLVNVEGRITLVNRQTEKMFGYTTQELLGQTVDRLVPDWESPSPAEHRAPDHQFKSHASGRDLYGRRKDGTIFPIEIGVNPICTEQGVFMLKVIIDVSARREAEDEISRLRDRLSHAGRVSTMGQLASALAHEINQPLGAILRNAEAAELVLQSPEPDLGELRAIVADILSDDHRAGDVIDRLRGLLRRKEPEFHPLDLRDLLRGVGILVRADASVRHVRLEMELAGDLPRIRGDSVQLQQVLLNLLLNGMDAVYGLPEARRVVTVGARAPVPVDGNPPTVELWVSDRGEGIPADKRERMFEPFFTTKAHGLGMGLAISRTIIEAHGGRIWAEENDAGGATMRMTLPALTGAAV